MEPSLKWGRTTLLNRSKLIQTETIDKQKDVCAATKTRSETRRS